MHISLKGSMDRQPLTDRLGDRLLAEYGGAAAAYSLRALNGNGDNVVRVRRASDNDEKDFTAEQIELGEMVNWVNSQTVPPLDIGKETEDGRIPVPEGGETIGTPAAAYSLRNLSTTYTGNVVDVRRSSDGNTQGFTAEEVSDGTLEAWVGAGNDGTVSKWYDQSGNTNHAVQTTPANQPTIVEGGSVLDELKFDGVDTFFKSSNTLSLTQPFTSFSLSKSNQAATSQGVWSICDNDTALFEAMSFFRNDSGLAINSGSTLTTAGSLSYLTGVNYLKSGIFNTTSSEIFVNGTSHASGTVGTNNPSGFLYIGRMQVPQPLILDGTISELILYPSDQSDNRTAIEANIGEYYGITGIPAYDNTVDGFVETWYDQSGNGNDAAQSVATGQPKIVDGGSLVAGGIDFDGTNSKFDINGFAPISLSYSAFVIASLDEPLVGALRTIFDSSDLTNGGFSIAHGNTTSKFTPFWFDGDDGASNVFSGGNDLTSAEALYSTIIKSGASTTHIDGTLNDTLGNTWTTAGSNSFSKSTIGYDQSTPTRELDGKIKEIILYTSDQSANRAAIEDNINAHYNIYP